MKLLKKIPDMKTRNLEEFERIRKLERESILFEKRFRRYFTVQSYLEEANNDYVEIHKILDEIPIIASDISSGVFELQWAAVYKMEFLIVTLDHDEAMHALLELNIIRHLLRFLEGGDGHVKIAGAKVLLKAVDGFPEYAIQVVDQGGTATVVGLLNSSHNEAKIQAMRVMSCASALPLKYRDGLIADGAITQLVVLVEPLLIDPNAIDRTKLLLNAFRASKNLCSGDPAPAIHQMEYLFPIVQRAILNVDLNGIFYSICIEACWTLYYIFRALARFAADKVFQYLNAEFSQRLIWLMQNADQELAEAIHQIVQRLALCCEQGLLQVLIDNELLRALNHNLTQVPNPAYQLLASRTIRCIIGSNRNRIQMLFDENLIQPLVQIIQDEELMEEVEVKVEAILIISGVVRNGTDLQIGIMVDLGCIQLVCENLYPLMTRATCFQAMRKIIQVKNRNRVDGVNIYVQEIANFGGDMIRTLQNDAHVGDIARWIMMYI